MCNQEKADNFKFYPDILGPMCMNSDFMIPTHRIPSPEWFGGCSIKVLGLLQQHQFTEYFASGAVVSTGDTDNEQRPKKSLSSLLYLVW